MTSSRDSRVTVVMITHNRCDEVLRSLEHLTCLPERPHIVVVDNGSEDGTDEAIGHRFPQVEVVPAGGNLGAAARNLGVRRVNTPYIALCDDDTWWEPGSLAHAAELFDASPRLAVVTARIIVEPQAREDPICAVLEHSPLPLEKGMPGPSLLGFLAGAKILVPLLKARGYRFVRLDEVPQVRDEIFEVLPQMERTPR